MIKTDDVIEYRRLRVPGEHGAVLVDPPSADVGEVIEANRAAAAERAGFDCRGRPLGHLAAAARRDLLRRARRYTTAYRDVDATWGDDRDPPLLLSGHQPELFHVGVWLKNLALGSYAARHRAAGIHVLIDNDAVHSTSVQVPTGSPQRSSLHAVPLDDPAADVPYETRPILNRERFASFGSRVESTLAPLVSKSMIHDFWPLAVEAARENENLGQCLSRARHQWESRWGYQTLELPLSHVCRTEPFLWLLADLIARGEQLYAEYNAALALYRSVFRLRSRTHPVPDLSERDGMFELPFWVWSAHDPTRRPLFAQRRGRRTVLRDLESFETDLALSPDGDASAAVGQLGKLTDQGIALRPRALMTTMFLRILLSDLFIHGIGGAKYDQVTDLLIKRLFGSAAPQFLVVSGTARLDIPHEEVEIQDIRRIDRLLRELTYHPERHLDQPSAAESDPEKIAQVIANKKFWIEKSFPRGQRKERHRQIEQANERLREAVTGKRSQLLAERARLLEARRNHRRLASREFAFCLFSESWLRNWCLDLFPPSS